ncbi:MAG: hypothetical protein K2Y32_14140 [Candidatus Obscuribacterales bacterium]|nr:hypothetical protein [Candidatus Obscuribacterales bacterium]
MFLQNGLQAEMEHLNWEAGVCIFTAVLAFVTLMLAGYTYKIAVDADLNAKASVKQASTIHEEQQKLSQRQLLVVAARNHNWLGATSSALLGSH